VPDAVGGAARPAPTRRNRQKKAQTMKLANKLAAIIETINRSGVLLKLAMIIAVALLVAALINAAILL